MNDTPKNNIVEVSLIGTGGGYGESIVLNLGNNNWIVVDSCQDPYTKKSLPLDYLLKLGIDVSKDVKLILCTHWHDDHILGISNLLNECVTADFCMATSTDKRKFLQLVGLDYSKVKSESSASSTIELNSCIDIIRSRGSRLINAGPDRVIFAYNNDDIKCQVISLSPSDFVLEEFNKEISTLMKEYFSPNRKIVIRSPNDKSVALLIKINNQSFILGSDLEVSEDDRRGWLCVLNDSQCIEHKASLFKIPHHGSENGFHQRIWDDIIGKNAIAKIAPWNRGDKLPKKEMLQKYKDYTENLYMTSPLTSNKPKKRERSIAKAINKFNKTVCEEKYSFGIIRCRFDFSNLENEWDVDLIEKAFEITDDYLAS